MFNVEPRLGANRALQASSDQSKQPRAVRLWITGLCLSITISITISANIAAYTASTIEKTDEQALQQGATADCGFYALFAALKLYQKQSLNDRKTFDQNSKIWKKLAEEKWGSNTWIGIDAIESLVDTCKIFAPIKKRGGRPHEDSFTDSIFVDNVVLIQNIYDIETVLEQLETKQVAPDDYFVTELKKSKLWKSISRLQRGERLIVITNLTSGPGDPGYHWFALELSWKNKKTLQCKCVNSLPAKLSSKKVVDKICLFVSSATKP